MVSSPNLTGRDTCDISAGNGTLWPVTAELSELVQYVAQAKLSKLWFHISISFQILDINNNFYFLSSSPPLFLRSTSIHESYYFTLRSITKLHDDIIISAGSEWRAYYTGAYNTVLYGGV